MSDKPLVIFLGNSIMKDDRIGLELGRRLKNELIGKGFDVEILERSGLGLIDYLEGRRLVIVVDSVVTNKYPTGSVLKLKVEDFRVCKGFSPHYAGLPEAVEVMKSLKLDVPKVYVIAVEVRDPYTPSMELTKELEDKISDIALEVKEKILEISDRIN